MPQKNTSTEREPVTLSPIMAGGKCVGIHGELNLYFDGDFAKEKIGNKYLVPIKARGVNGRLAAAVENGKVVFPTDYQKLDLLKDGEGTQLYVNTDCSLTDWPYTGDSTRSPIKPGVCTSQEQATPHTDFRKTMTPENVIWPDGKVRKVALEIKANNPESLETFTERKVQATQKRQATSVSTIAANNELTARAMFANLQGNGKDYETIQTIMELAGLEIPADLRPVEATT